MTAGFFMPAVLVAGFTNSLHTGPQAVFLGLVQPVKLRALVGYFCACLGVVAAVVVLCSHPAEAGRLVERLCAIPESGHGGFP